MKGVVLGLESNLAIGTFLGFVGYRHVAIELMQTLSHSTRAYIVKEDGLKGFVKRMDIVKILNDADLSGKLDEVKKWQVIDFKEVEKEIEGFHTVEQMMDHFCLFEPILYRFLLKHQG